MAKLCVERVDTSLAKQALTLALTKPITGKRLCVLEAFFQNKRNKFKHLKGVLE